MRMLMYGVTARRFAKEPTCFALFHIFSNRMSRVMRFPTMWYVRPAKAQTRLSHIFINQVSSDTRFPTMWYERPAKAQTSLRIRADCSEPLLVA